MSLCAMSVHTLCPCVPFLCTLHVLVCHFCVPLCHVYAHSVSLCAMSICAHTVSLCAMSVCAHSVPLYALSVHTLCVSLCHVCVCSMSLCAMSLHTLCPCVPCLCAHGVPLCAMSVCAHSHVPLCPVCTLHVPMCAISICATLSHIQRADRMLLVLQVGPAGTVYNTLGEDAGSDLPAVVQQVEDRRHQDQAAGGSQVIICVG